MTEFREFNKIPRLSKEMYVTEKLDGTNGTIFIGEDDEFLIGSRNRWITPEADNYGFARWATDHKDELMALGPGWHRGEWWGKGIQRKYNVAEKRFSLFNVNRWLETEAPPACCHVVPLLYQGPFDTFKIAEVMEKLQEEGSVAAPGFPNPEGIVIYHIAAGQYFKKTFEGDNHKGT